jgi:hypothetical protein
VFPISLTNIGWKIYMINASWDVLVVFFIWWYWVETKGRTLEEIDRELDGEKHSDAPDLEDVLSGQATVEPRDVSIEKEKEDID